MGMERIVPSFSEFEVLVSMLTRSAVAAYKLHYGADVRQQGEADVLRNSTSWLWITGVPAYSARNSNRCCNVSAAPPASTSVPCTGMSADTRTGPSIRVRSAPSYRLFSADMTNTRSSRTHLPYARVRKRVRLKFRCTSCCSSIGRTLWKRGQSADQRKLAMKAFGLGSSSPSLYKMGSKWAPAAMTPFTEDDKISKVVVKRMDGNTGLPCAA